MGRWSALVAAEFVPRLEVASHAQWVDIGCGTGRLSRTIAADADPELVVGIDPSTGFVRTARRRGDGLAVNPVVGDGLAMPVADDRFDAAVSGLVLNFVPDPTRLVAEMGRVVRPGGVVAWYVWDYDGAMALLRYFWDAATDVDPSASRLDEGVRFPVCRPDALRGLAESAGLVSVESWAIEVRTAFEDFDDYWAPFRSGQGPAPGFVAGLSEARRRQLRARLEASVPTEADGSIDLRARAWAVRGRVPSSP